jgi:quercetin dioxygenase-like cupin family protein
MRVDTVRGRHTPSRSAYREDRARVRRVFDVTSGGILDRSAALIRSGGTLVPITMQPEARREDGWAVFFIVGPDRAPLAGLATRLGDGRHARWGPLVEAPRCVHLCERTSDTTPSHRRTNRRSLVIAKRIAVGALAAATLTTVTACSTPDRPTLDKTHTGAAAAPVASKRPTDTLKLLLQHPLPNIKGKTFTSAIVDFPPNAHAVPHRHGQAFVYAYVLEGTVRSRIAGKPVGTYHRGEDWVELPGAHHVLTENTSRTRPAKLLAIFVSNTGEPLKVDDPGQ